MIKVIKAGVASTEKRKIDTDIQNTVSNIIDQIEAEGDDALRRLSAKFDKWDRPSYRLSESEIEKILASVPESVKDDVKFAQKQVRTFAEAQRSALRDVEVETLPGIHLGHKNIPVNSVGAYVPGGRYPMVASAHMSIVTAKVDRFLRDLTNYGALFLGPETNVAFGDKVIGTNHTLPTGKAARYTSGLWVGKFLKTVTFQRCTPEASAFLGEYC